MNLDKLPAPQRDPADEDRPPGYVSQLLATVVPPEVTHLAEVYERDRQRLATAKGDEATAAMRNIVETEMELIGALYRLNRAVIVHGIRYSVELGELYRQPMIRGTRANRRPIVATVAT
jgi:hypothetical protein